MKKSMELRQARKKSLDAARAVLDKAEGENRGLTAEEKTEFERHTAEAKALEERIERLEAQEAEEARLVVPAGGGESRSGSGQEVLRPEPEGSLEVGRTRLEDDPRKGYRNAREFLTDVMAAAQGRPVARRASLQLLDLRRVTGQGEQRAAGSDEQSTFADPYGGYLLPEAFTPSMLRLEPESDPIGGRTRRIPMQATIVNIPARVDKDHTSSVSGGLTVGRSAESVSKDASRMEFERIRLEVFSLFGMTYATEEILTDSPQSFVALISSGFQDEFNGHMVEERLNGTGVGQFLGIMNSPAVVQVNKETGQAATTIVYENVIKMRARCWQYNNAVWLANHDCIPQLMVMNLAIGTGGVPVWQPAQIGVQDHPDMLLGRPLIFTEYCATVGTVGDLVLVNWNEYLEGLYQPLQSAESIHVRFANHERAFKFWLRNAGAPWWRAAFTPKRGSSLSPFIKLQSRT